MSHMGAINSSDEQDELLSDTRDVKGYGTDAHRTAHGTSWVTTGVIYSDSHSQQLWMGFELDGF